MNVRIAKWLDEGNLLDLLNGNGEYRIDDPDYYGKQDVMLITRTLIEWSISRNSSIQAARLLESSILEILGCDPVAAADIMLSYAINAQDMKTSIGIDFEKSLKRLSEIAQGKHRDFDRSTCDQIERLLPILNKRLLSIRSYHVPTVDS